VPPLHRRRPVAVDVMCRKFERRCPAQLRLREEALEEWTGAETFSDVCRAWGVSAVELRSTATALNTTASLRAAGVVRLEPPCKSGPPCKPAAWVRCESVERR
jgi:hypothetical protein